MGNEVGLMSAAKTGCSMALEFPSPMGNEVGLIFEFEIDDGSAYYQSFRPLWGMR